MFGKKVSAVYLGMFAYLFGAGCLAATPEIDSVTGTFSDGQTVTITGKNFTAKANAKPLLYWFADGGTLPSPLGRKTAWDGSFSGDLVDKNVSAILAPGSSKAIRQDYSTTSAAILGRVSFSSDYLYVWRKRYDDFDRSKDYAIRTRYTGLKQLGSATAVTAGMIVSSLDKTVFGKIIKSEPGANGAGTAYYSNDFGNIWDNNFAGKLALNDKIYFYSATDTLMLTPLFEASLAEGSGVFYTFNHKIFRMWGQYGKSLNDTYISLDKDGTVVNENTQVGTFWRNSWDNPIDSATERWAVEEFQYKAGTVDVADGILLYWQDRVQAWSNHTFRFTTSTWPTKYSDVYQNQVSNGAQPLSFEYFDSLYIDDTWHRVLICSESTWSACVQPEIQIPVSWTDTQIKINLRLGSLKDPARRYYFYVVNANGEVNASGPINPCPLCPAKVK